MNTSLPRDDQWKRFSMPISAIDRDMFQSLAELLRLREDTKIFDYALSFCQFFIAALHEGKHVWTARVALRFGAEKDYDSYDEHEFNLALFAPAACGDTIGTCSFQVRPQFFIEFAQLKETLHLADIHAVVHCALHGFFTIVQDICDGRHLFTSYINEIPGHHGTTVRQYRDTTLHSLPILNYHSFDE